MRNVTFSLLGLLIISLALPLLFAGNDLSEKDRIISAIKNESTIAKETTRIKEIRNEQINALLEVVNDYQRSVVENRPNRRSVPSEAAILLLGDLRAVEAVEPLISFMCFLIDDETSTGVFGLDYQLAMESLQSAVYDALTKIGKPTIKPLIDLLRNGTNRIHFRHTLTEDGKKDLIEAEKKFSMKDGSSNGEKARFARKSLYLIEGDCAVHYLERAYNAETDQKKKDNLSEQITKFKEEVKSGAYKK
ncbi:MAG: hypothetical protein WC980_09950 [Candidatus Brocadiia bacterium]